MNEVTEHLIEYERLTAEERALREKNVGVLRRLMEIETLKKEIHDRMRRSIIASAESYAMPEGDGDDVGKRRVHTIGVSHLVLVQYKQRAAYYKPERVPPVLFAQTPTLVETINTKVADRVAKQNERLRAAKEEGEWMVPTLLIQPRNSI